MIKTFDQTIAEIEPRGKTIFEKTILTGSFYESEPIEICGKPLGCLFIVYQRGKDEISAILIVKTEFSDDGINWFREPSADGSAKTDTAVVPGSMPGETLMVPLGAVHANYMRVSVKETGTKTNYGAATIMASWVTEKECLCDEKDAPAQKNPASDLLQEFLLLLAGIVPGSIVKNPQAARIGVIAMGVLLKVIERLAALSENARLEPETKN